MEEQGTNAKRIAEELVAWSAENGLFDGEVAEAASQEFDNSVFSGFADSEEEVESILHAKGVTFIGYSDADEKVIIYTNRKPTKAHIKKVGEAFSESGVSVECRQGGFATVKDDPATPFGVAAGELYNGRYSCGSSVHVVNPVGAGTMGALVTDGQDVFGLSNNHVTGMCSFADLNLPVIAPGSIDVKADSIDPFTIGHHYSTLPMADGTPNNVDVDQNTDAALFKLANSDLVTSMQRDVYDTPSQVVSIQPGMLVEKVGRTTGHTRGLVESVSIGPVPIQYSYPAQRLVYFSEMYVVRSTEEGRVFATSGDSGSLVTSLSPSGERFAVGLVVGESKRDQITFVLPLVPILDRFGVSLVCNHNL